MSQLVLARGNRHKKGICRRTISADLMVSPFSLIGVLVIFVSFSGLLYLTNFNQAAMKGYDIKRLDDQRRQLLEKYEQGNNQLSELTSLTYIKESDVVLKMVKPREVIYVRGETPTVASASN